MQNGEPIQGAFDSGCKGYKYALKSEDLSKTIPAIPAEYWDALRQGDAEHLAQHEKQRMEELLEGFKQFHESRSQYAAKSVGMQLAQEATDPDILLKLSDAIAVDPAYNGISYAISANPHVTGSVMSNLIERQLTNNNVAAATRLMRSPKADPRYVDVILDHMAQPNYRAVHYDIRDRITDLLGTAHSVPDETLNDLMSPDSKERWNTKIDNRNHGDYGAVLDGLSEYARRDLHNDPAMYKKIFHTITDNNVEYEPYEYTQANNISALVNNDINYANDKGVPPRLGLDEVVQALPYSSSAKHHPILKGPDVQSKLQALVKSPDRNIREGVATILQDPKAMYDDPDVFVQRALVKNPRTAPEHVIKMLGHSNRGLHRDAQNRIFSDGGGIQGNPHMQNLAAKQMLQDPERTDSQIEQAIRWALPDTLDDALNGKYHQSAAVKAMQAPNLTAPQIERIFNLKDSHPDEYYKKDRTSGAQHAFDSGYHPDDNDAPNKCVHCGKTRDDHSKLSIEQIDPAAYHYEIDTAKKKARYSPNIAPERLNKIIDNLLEKGDTIAGNAVDLDTLVRRQKNLSPQHLEKIKQGIIDKYADSTFGDRDHTFNLNRRDDVLGAIAQHANTAPATLEDLYKNRHYLNALKHKNMPAKYVHEVLTRTPPPEPPEDNEAVETTFTCTPTHSPQR